MAESVTIARPYAEAAFRVAKETGALGIGRSACKSWR
jgi:F0F1-type ATP synthase delta subunit